MRALHVGAGVSLRTASLVVDLLVEQRVVVDVDGGVGRVIRLTAAGPLGEFVQHVYTPSGYPGAPYGGVYTSRTNVTPGSGIVGHDLLGARRADSLISTDLALLAALPLDGSAARVHDWVATARTSRSVAYAACRDTRPEDAVTLAGRGLVTRPGRGLVALTEAGVAVAREIHGLGPGKTSALDALAKRVGSAGRAIERAHKVEVDRAAYRASTVGGHVVFAVRGIAPQRHAHRVIDTVLGSESASALGTVLGALDLTRGRAVRESVGATVAGWAGSHTRAVLNARTRSEWLAATDDDVVRALAAVCAALDAVRTGQVFTIDPTTGEILDGDEYRVAVRAGDAVVVMPGAGADPLVPYLGLVTDAAGATVAQATVAGATGARVRGRRRVAPHGYKPLGPRRLEGRAKDRLFGDGEASYL